MRSVGEGSRAVVRHREAMARHGVAPVRAPYIAAVGAGRLIAAQDSVPGRDEFVGHLTRILVHMSKTMPSPPRVQVTGWRAVAWTVAIVTGTLLVSWFAAM